MKELKFFVSYSHLDSRWLKEFRYRPEKREQDTDLIPWLEKSLRNVRPVTIWYDHALREEPGELFADKIRQKIVEADCAILVISSHFLNSGFIRTHEMPWIKERVEKEDLIVIPIMVGPAIWDVAPDLAWIRERHIIPGEEEPLIDFIERPGSWEKMRIEILKSILARIRNLEPANSKPTPPAPDKTAKTQYGRHPFRNAMIAIAALAGIILLATVFPQKESKEGGERGKPVTTDSLQQLANGSKGREQSGSSNIPSSNKEDLSAQLAAPENRADEHDRPAVSTTLSAESRLWVNSIGMVFVKIPAGELRIGAAGSSENKNTGPGCLVRFPQPFYLSRYEVTQREWFQVLGRRIQDQQYRGTSPRRFRGIGDRYPVYYISFRDVTEFIARLNQMEKTQKYRLPTEAEWEYAARAGDKQDAPIGLEHYAWYGEEIGEGSLHPVGLLKANPWGLHDMLGNAAELIVEYYAHYPVTERENPLMISAADGRFCLRGGSVVDDALTCQFSYRTLMNGDASSSYTGFRVLMELP